MNYSLSLLPVFDIGDENSEYSNDLIIELTNQSN